MDSDLLSRKAADLHKAASHPALADVLYSNSICAEWNDKAQTFDAIRVSGLKSHRMTPNQSERFMIRFLAADPTDEVAVRTRVAKRMAELGKTKRERRLPKRS